MTKMLCGLIMAIALLTSCSPGVTNQGYGKRQATYSSEFSYGDDAVNDEGAEAVIRRITYTGRLTLVDAQPDTIIERARILAENVGGYLLRSSSNRLAVNVPAAKLETTLDQMETLAKVEDRSLSSLDFTEEYANLDIRLANATKARDRYISLLDEAVTVADIVSIERELERLNGELDQMQGRMKRLNEMEAYSLIELTVRQKPKLGPVGYLLSGVWEVVEWIF